jgi:hypothetical protein
MQSKSAVTTAQIVNTMKRGENGSIKVSMAIPLGDFARLLLWEARCRAQAIRRGAQAYDRASPRS